MYKKYNKLLLLLIKCPAIRGISPEYPNTDNPTGVIGMMRCMRLLPVFLLTVVALILGIAALVSCKDGGAQVPPIPFADARIIFEVNSTDEDAGIQVFLDGEPWNEVMIFNPNEQQIFEALGRGNLKGFGLAELFSESNEPPFDEVSLQEVLDMFPAGNYEFKGTTVEGGVLESTAALTHDIPCGPEIVSPDAGEVLDPNETVVIEWEEVTSKLDPATGECDAASAIDIIGYQVIVDTFQVTLPADATSVTVPPEFIEPNTMYKFEVLAIEDAEGENGNQTITSSFFCTDQLTPCPAP